MRITRLPVENTILRDLSFEDAHHATAAGSTAAAFRLQAFGGKLGRLQNGSSVGYLRRSPRWREPD
jgi:hypothetical protein